MPTTPRTAACAVLPSAILVAVLATGCSSPTRSGGPPYDLDIPTSWASEVTNPFLPLTPGTTRTYEAATEDGLETTIVEVLGDTRVVNGVTATVVHDRVYVEGELIEDTIDWYAQAMDGTVWYLGEDVKNYENGELVDTEGSFEWGLDGALPGVVMWADPASHVGEEYRQEFYEDEAEDWGKVVSVAQNVSIPFADFAGCVVTDDWNGLEPTVVERKTYCPGVGVVRELQTAGGDEEVLLVGIEEP